MPIPESMVCRCVRCEHQWVKRIEGRPARCPSCKQYNWDKELGEVKIGRPLKKKAARRKAA